MKKLSEEQQREELRQRIIGLGERSLKKSYYPELQKQIIELEKTNIELQREIQERKQTEEIKKRLEFQLVQAQKMEAIGALAAGIAHDFNNILSAIIGYTELAKIHLVQCPEADKCPITDDLDGVLRSADRAKQLVHQILSFSSKQAGEPVSVAMESVVLETVRMLRATIPTSIAIEHEIRITDSMVKADPTRLHQVLMNLGTNAYHAMRGTSGVIHFELSETLISENNLVFNDLQLASGPYITIRVSDTGCGIDRNTLARIFDPYFTTKTDEGGTGLGLSVAHGIITQHKGHISDYSELGKGSTFCIYLPRLEDQKTEKKRVKRQKKMQGRERLMIVDDERDLATLMARILEDLGYHVTSCSSPAEALEHIRSNPQGFDLLITDMNMPDMNGAELIQQVRGVRQNFPVILCTGFSEFVNDENIKALGVARYLTKPVTRGELHDAIRSLLDPQS